MIKNATNIFRAEARTRTTQLLLGPVLDYVLTMSELTGSPSSGWCVSLP